MSTRQITRNKTDLMTFLQIRERRDIYPDEVEKKAKRKCEYCGNEMEHIHHIIPRSVGGSNSIDNLVGVCKKCHLKAHNYDFSNQHGLNEEMLLYFQKINNLLIPKTISEAIEQIEILKKKTEPFLGVNCTYKTTYFYSGKFEAYSDILKMLKNLEEVK